MTSKRAGRVLIALGALCIIAAAVLLCHNRAEERRADDAAQSAMPAIVQGIAEARAVRTNTAPARDPDIGVEADGERYLGFLSLPSLSLELPVLYDWDGVKLQSAPCRYSGSLAAGALVLGAHNYSYHFGGIAELAPGDAVYFTDRGIEELTTRREGEQLDVEWLALRLRAFVDLNPQFEDAVERLATFLARDDEDDLD